MAEHDPSLSVGAYLRALRDAKHASLEDMARATRIGVAQLEALESDRFSELPASVFVKGFIRAYCHFLGEPCDDAVRRYRDMRGEPAAPERPAPPRWRLPAWLGSPVFASIILLVVFGGGLVALNKGFRPGPPPPMKPPVTAQLPSPAPNPLAPAPAAAPVEGPATQRLLVRAIEPTWIRIQTDDLRAVQELLPPGATREWTAERRFVLTVGNAGGIEVELNGRAMPRLGQSGAVIRQLELPKAAAAGS